MTEKIGVSLIGATGYTGMEMIRLLCLHPVFELKAVTSRQEAGKKIEKLFPHFTGHSLAELEVIPPDPELIAKKCQLAFLAVPHGTAMEMAAQLLNRGLKVVDLSADFRLLNREVYEHWYQVEHKYPELLAQAVYGLVELYEEKISSANLIANPGCYPTSVLLALKPVLEDGLIQTQGLIADSKSGASGAGRKAKLQTLFCEVYDNFKPYSLSSHRHTPEIEQELSRISGEEIRISFNPHLLPIDRGIVTTIYARPNPKISLNQILASYQKHYAHKPWIRLLSQGELPQAKNVRGTMFCDLGLVLDERTETLIIVSAIDNLCRGASGQALANANLAFGLPVNFGLEAPSLTP